VPCILGQTHKIVGVQSLSRETHRVAQTREVDATMMVLSAVQDRGLGVKEVAHDMNIQLTKKLEEAGYENSYDTWHGTKGVANAMKSIAVGAKRDMGVKWHPQISDKRASTKRHAYWAMANCGGSGQRLRELLINIVEHYKDNHAGCHHTSYCKRPNYTANKDILTDPQAIDAFSKKIKSLAIYRHADSYARCRDTFWVESFNHALLSYLPKRIHFGDAAYHMRMDIAVMDWNENVDREITSEKQVVDVRRPNRRTPFKCRKAKTDNFRWKVWTRWVHQVSGVASYPAAEESVQYGDVREDHPFIDVFHAEPLVYDDGDSDHFED
jgi:hypothetical protein